MLLCVYGRVWNGVRRRVCVERGGVYHTGLEAFVVFFLAQLGFLFVVPFLGIPGEGVARARVMGWTGMGGMFAVRCVVCVRCGAVRGVV